MVSTSMQPIFAHLVDIRHTCMYGNVYAISDMAVCLAMFVGKFIAILQVMSLPFHWDIVLYNALHFESTKCIGFVRL